MCSHFNTEDGGKYATFSAHYALFFQERYTCNWNPKKICGVYGKGAVSDRTCQKWFVKLQAGDFSLDDAAWSGKQLEVHSDQIKTLIKNDQHHTMQEIADILKIAKSIKWRIYLLSYGKKHTDFLANPIRFDIQ